MSALKGNQDIACFLVTKISWKGKYKRIFSIGSMGISTYNPTKLEVTNQWLYSDLLSIAPVSKGSSDEFMINIKKGKKTDTMKFSSEHRAEILTEALKHKDKLAEPSVVFERFTAFKHQWSDNRIPMTLEVSVSSVLQKDAKSGNILASYEFKDIEHLIPVSDYSGGFVIICESFGRQHLFSCDRRDEIMKKIVDHALCYVGVCIKISKDTTTFQNFKDHRLGIYSTDEAITSVNDFSVHKISSRHKEPVKRVLGLTESCIVERDPRTYSIISLKPLSEIFAIVRCTENPQVFEIEDIRAHVRKYTSTERDALLASLVDGVRASGNSGVHVKMKHTNRGQRIGPFSIPVDEDIESSHLKFFQFPPAGWDFADVVFHFNDNVLYSGLVHSSGQENKEKLIQTALVALLEKEGDQDTLPNDVLEAQFQAIRRLVASKIGFATFTQHPRFREKLGMKVVKALKRNDDGVAHSCIDMLCALMQPMHNDYDLRQEQLNKSSLLSSKKFLEGLIEIFIQHVQKGSGALVVASMLDFLTFALCAPYSETTDGSHFDNLLNMVADNGRCLFRLFQHPSLAIVKGAGLVMKAIIEEGDPTVASKMQELSLAEGALPRHLHIAMFTQTTDSRLLALQQLSRHLVALWVSGHPIAMGLLHRILPNALLILLDSQEKVPEKSKDYINIRDNLQIAQDMARKNMKNIPYSWQTLEKHFETIFEHWRAKMGLPKKEDKNQQRPIALRKRRERMKNDSNWPLFYYYFNQDHRQPDLIWNCRTREELKDTLENEMRSFVIDKELSRTTLFSWNHAEFEAQYHSLDDEIKIGEYYLRLLLEEEQKEGSNSYIRKSYEFFNDLYHRFLLTSKPHMKAMCLQAMAIVYGRHHEDIGPFNDTRFIVGMLERCFDKLERDRLIIFMSKLILNRKNVKELLDANGIKILVELLTLAHLHTSRATIPTHTNVIEAAPHMMEDTEKEWYYQNEGKERNGPYSFNEMKEFWVENVINSKTKCWAQGMDGWRPIQSIPQLKWCLMATGTPLMDESELATQILKMLIQICEYFPSRDSDGAVIRPLPKAKRLLSESISLPHIVQLLLTFDPVLVEKVASLLTLVIQDNPDMPRLYLTGFFYFILMYTGSNLLPIGNLLQITHASQAFRSDEAQSSSLMTRSILGQLLPEAMVCYLENHGAEKFAEIFLGEFDTPEAIWNNEMRRMMIEKIAAHLADFTPRLRSNTRALYQYCAIPVIQYPQLERELFCNIYYLRHLCDTVRFPDWPIKDPVRLLKDVLESWKREVERKPSAISVEEAYETLELDVREQHDESLIRKAYFKLAQKYHPDKNPDGREIFEKVNKAYEFLCSKSSKQIEGPDPDNIVLILKSQAILFCRYKEELHPYKYSGYPMLVKTIRMETCDAHLFSKSAPLLAAATETAYYTVNCSALNAEELRREGGLEALQEAFARCVAVISHSSKMEDLAVQVCVHISQCFSVAAQFRGCRERMTEMPVMIRDLCHILFYEHLTKLCTFAVQCISALAVDETLQNHMFQAGVLFHLLQFFFHFDFTLEEGGVERSEETNQQEVANQLAKLSVVACSRLSGLSGEESTPKNTSFTHALIAMLTPYLAKQLNSSNSSQVLKMMNSNTENPYLIWNNATRAELLDYLKTQQKNKVRSGDCDPSYGANFTFSSLSSELVIGDIFVRIYNKMATFPLQNPKKFTLELLDYLCSQAQYLYSLMALSSTNLSEEANKNRLENVEMALEALGNVIRSNPGVEIQCIGHFKLLFSLLRLENCTKVQALAIEVIAGVTGTQECVADISASNVLVYLLLILHSFPQSNSQVTVLETLMPLMSNGKLVKEGESKGAIIYLLNLFCNSCNPRVRELAAELLGKMTSDKLLGPKIRITLSKFLPELFIDAMKEKPCSSVHMFEGSDENPELIWNDDARERLCLTVSKLSENHYRTQRDEPAATWKIPSDLDLSMPEEQGEIVVAGVYLRLFIQNPAWVIRKPKEFLIELFNTISNLMSKEIIVGETIETVSQALILLLQAQPSLLEEIPGLGFIPQILNKMEKDDSVVCGACLHIAQQFSYNESCTRCLSQSDFITLIMKAMKIRKDLIGVACETLNNVFRKCNEDLIQQAIENKLVPHLLGLLDSQLNTSSASTKAQIVQALKAMCLSLQYGDMILSMLNESSVWAEYKDQKHDLFISDVPTAGYLTAGTPAVAGYLTQGLKAMPSSPPPMEDG